MKGRADFPNRNVIIHLFSAFVILITAASANAATALSNVEGFVLKEARCSSSFSTTLVGNLSNKSKTALKGTVYATIFDTDGDPVGNCSMRINLRPISGTSFSEYCNCKGGNNPSVYLEFVPN